MRKVFLLVTFCLFLAVNQSIGQTPVRQAGNGAPLPSSVDFGGATALPVTLQNGSAFAITMEGITSPVSTSRLTAYVEVKLAGTRIPFPMPDEVKDACTTGTAPGTCPVAQGQVFDYVFYLEGQLLSICQIVQIEIGLRADNGDYVTAIELDVHVIP